MDSRIINNNGQYKVLSRGVLVVDHGLVRLGKELGRLNIRVIPVGDYSDETIMQGLLPGRILITKRPRVFIDGAYCYEYGIISVKGLPLKLPQKAARCVSKVLAVRNLWSKKHGFLVQFQHNGRSNYRELIG